MKNKLTLLAVGLLLAGCSTRTITYKDASYSSKRFAQKEDIDGLKIVTPDGTTIELVGYRNDQVQAIGVAVDAAVKAAVNSAKP